MFILSFTWTIFGGGSGGGAFESIPVGNAREGRWGRGGMAGFCRGLVGDTTVEFTVREKKQETIMKSS
jgi:hypothetical protein